MKRFEKRTIALLLASVITVAGSFAAENYKNSLMGLNFSILENGAVNMSVETKSAYSGNVTPIRRDMNTFMLTLPEMNSKINKAIDIQNTGGNIESVEIKTLPYTNTGKGYTRIIIKTNSSIDIIGQNKIFIPENNPTPAAIENRVSKPQYSERTVENKKNFEPEPIPQQPKTQPETIEKTAEQPLETPAQAPSVEAPAPVLEVTSPTTTENDKEPFEAFLLVLGIMLVLTVSVYLSVRAKNKIQEITGEKIDIDINDEEVKPKKESKRKQIKNAIKKLDSTYSKTAVSSVTSEYPQATEPVKTVKPSEELNVVDLDELFKEQQEKTKEENEETSNQDNDENDALTEFLNGFSFDEEHDENKNQEQDYDYEYYDKIINKNDITFSQDDVDCINQLLSTEIDNNVIQNLKDKEIKETTSVKQKTLEDLVSTYTISQNITFTAEDIQTLKKLMSVEIDNEFITDLRTNPERTKQMQAEITPDKPKRHKPSEILTLNVKDMLPDLSEALRKQGGRKIESEIKPITVYASEGYEVSTLSLNDTLPDLSIEINKESAYESKPSAELELVDNSWEVDKLNISNVLPDLKEVIKNPDLYNDPEPEPVKIDEEALLKNISNVQFKPFYDGNEDFEILNDFDTPSIDDIHEEFKQFDNFTAEVKEEEEVVVTATEETIVEETVVEETPPKEKVCETNTDEHSANSQIKDNKEFFDLDKIKKPEFVPKNLERQKDEKAVSHKRTKTQASEDIMKKIEATKAERLQRRQKVLQEKQQTLIRHEKEEQKTEIKCILDGEAYTVISTTEFSKGKGCYLAKSETGYEIIGFINNKYIKLKHYDSLKSEKITSRLSEKAPDNTEKYIIRIGLSKFVLKVTEDNIEYIMAL